MTPPKPTTRQRPGFGRLLAPFALLAMAGCAVGPNFKKPEPPESESYSKKPLQNPKGTAGVEAGSAQRFRPRKDIPAEWWTLFHSKPLNRLVESSLQANPTIKAAQEALVVARENTKAQVGAYFPSLSAGFAATRQKTAASLAPIPSSNALYYNLYTPQVSVSYVPDVFGLNRRTVESLKAQAEQQRYALEASLLTLSSNVVAAAIQEASLRRQIDVTNRIIESNTKMIEIMRKSVAAGYANRLDLAQQEAQLAQARALLPPLAKQLAQQRDLISALAGRVPSNEPSQTFDIASLDLPRSLPVSLPSRLVEQRPDVRQAEENLHAASALIGVAVANRLPNFNLTGSAGTSALELSQLFAAGGGVWALGAAAAQPLFTGGALLHKQRAAQAAYRQAEAQYRSTVLTALQNVADTLHALEQDGNALREARNAEQAAKVTLDLAAKQVQLGYANAITLLNAEQTYQQAAIGLVQAQSNRLADTAALFQALGGGWWNRTP
jgi:NodT family efflux transporter outer membrane factor (OMF) lipoprotein